MVGAVAMSLPAGQLRALRLHAQLLTGPRAGSAAAAARHLGGFQAHAPTPAVHGPGPARARGGVGGGPGHVGGVALERARVARAAERRPRARERRRPALARRYLGGYGPAAPAGFAAWDGAPAAVGKRGW